MFGSTMIWIKIIVSWKKHSKKWSVSMAQNHERTVFGLLRHAATHWNEQKRIQGHRDSPLTEQGIIRAQGWGQQLQAYPWDRIIASDLGRTVHTASLVNEHMKLPVETDSGLREQDWGRWTGRTLAQLEDEDPELFSRQLAAGWCFRPPGGESRISVWERSCRALISAAEKWPGKRILVVTHEGVIKSLVYRISRRRFLPEEPPLLGPMHLHRLACIRGRLHIEEINAVALA
jgi:probable phosphoglycerate mutase